MKRIQYFVIALLVQYIAPCTLFANALRAEVVLNKLEVHPTNASIFNSPIATYNNNIYFVAIIPPPKGIEPNGYNLQTIVYKLSFEKGKWKQHTKLIEPRTIEDRWHTQPSIGIDELGYIHIAYNMHNLPWQYVVSKSPDDISNFEFKGQSISLAEIKKLKIENKTSFPSVGEAAIPGNQITYPKFFNDRFGRLYVTYRFKMKPAKKWNRRSNTGGVAVYRTDSKQWESIGGAFAISNEDATFRTKQDSYIHYPFIYTENYTPYLIQLAFDIDNKLHVSWTWRSGGAGMACVNPCYSEIDNYSKFPFSFHNHSYKVDRSHQGYFAETSLAVYNNSPIMIVNPIEKPRKLIDLKTGIKEDVPYGATQIRVDNTEKIWAFANGPKIFKRNSNLLPWQKQFMRDGATFVKVFYDKANSCFLLYMHIDQNHIKILRFKI